MIDITHNIRSLQRSLKSRARKIDQKVATEIQKEAYKTHSDLTLSTPVGFTGDTRRAWKVKRLSMNPIFMRVHNDENVMYWLEHGTKRRFPRRTKNLFIPQRHSAWKRGGYKKGMKWGKDFVFAKSAKGLKPLGLIPKQQKVTFRRVANTLKKILQ